MSLQEQMSAFKKQFQSGKPPFDAVPASVHEAMARATSELVASGAEQRVRAAGPAPLFELQDEGGAIVRLADLLARGPVALSFYRGVWCPYCNMDLRALRSSAAEIAATGATLVIISPQTAANSRKTIAEHGAGFPILSDPGNAVADRYGLRFRLPDYLIEVYRQLGVDLPSINGDDSWTLPMPARIAIDRRGIIRYAEAHADYTQGSEPEELLRVLRELQRSGAD
jgi:peroxiredoxin